MARNKLSPSRIARYYFHECDRYLRYTATLNSQKKARGGVRYDGLFYVDGYWQQDGKRGFKIWRYRRVAEGEQAVPPVLDAHNPLPSGEPKPKRQEIVTQRIARNTSVGSAVKSTNRYRCQSCDLVLETPAGSYAEAAHIRPLGRPHNGPDTPGNIPCLCPNHHVLFNAGSLYIRDDLTVINALTGDELGSLTTHPKHSLSQENLLYHPDHWAAS